MNTFDKELKVALALAKEAGKVMLQYFDGEKKVRMKKDNSAVTVADTLINSLVIQKISRAFPEDGIVGEEESTAEYGRGRRWICDPIDGTNAFICGIPTCMFSLGFVVDGEPVLGVAYDPFLENLFVGRKGVQSTRNGKKISVSNMGLEKGFTAVDSLKPLATVEYFKRMIADKLKLVYVNGTVFKASLVARGKLCGLVAPGASPHDIAAIHAIVEGAGGKVTSISGAQLDYSETFKGAIFSNGVVHEKLVEYCGG